MSSHISDIYGLVLVGGKSTRMGTDKSLLSYHGMSQWAYNVKLLEGLVSKVLLSVRKGQKIEYPHLIEDAYEGLGPFGAILTAMERYPDKAFMILATDIPFISREKIQNLIAQRSANYMAIAYKSTHKDYAEPLVCVWEASVLPIMKKLQKDGVFKLQRVFKNISVKTLPIDDYDIQNINTSEEYQKIQLKK